MTNKPKSCVECNNSEITLMNNYLRCKLTGNCYIPSVMSEKISKDCPIYSSYWNEEDDTEVLDMISDEVNGDENDKTTVDE